MKTIFKIMMTVAIAIGSTSCGDIDSVHEKYYDLGGQPYIGVSDIQGANPGFEKAEVIWKISADTRIENCYIYWNKGTDSAIVAPDRTDTVMKYVIPLSEGAHMITMVNKSAEGDVSLERTMPVAVYGEEYKASLDAQAISSISSINSPSDRDVTINWAGLEGCIGMKITYTNTNDQAATQMTWISSGQSTLFTDAKLGSEFTYESFYHPSENALDTVISPVIGEGIFPVHPPYYILTDSDWANYSDDHTVLATTGWEITTNSEEAPAQAIGNILDGDFSTIWHCSHSTELEDMPYTINLDMQENKIVSSILLDRRGAAGTSGTGATKRVDIEYSTNGIDWSSGGAIKFPTNANTGAMVCFLSEEFEARYLRLSIPEVGGSFEGKWATLSELVITTPK